MENVIELLNANELVYTFIVLFCLDTLGISILIFLALNSENFVYQILSNLINYLQSEKIVSRIKCLSKWVKYYCILICGILLCIPLLSFLLSNYSFVNEIPSIFSMVILLLFVYLLSFYFLLYLDKVSLLIIYICFCNTLFIFLYENGYIRESFLICVLLMLNNVIQLFVLYKLVYISDFFYQKLFIKFAALNSMYIIIIIILESFLYINANSVFLTIINRLILNKVWYIFVIILIVALFFYKHKYRTAIFILMLIALPFLKLNFLMADFKKYDSIDSYKTFMKYNSTFGNSIAKVQVSSNGKYKNGIDILIQNKGDIQGIAFFADDIKYQEYPKLDISLKHSNENVDFTVENNSLYTLHNIHIDLKTDNSVINETLESLIPKNLDLLGGEYININKNIGETVPLSEVIVAYDFSSSHRYFHYEKLNHKEDQQSYDNHEKLIINDLEVQECERLSISGDKTWKSEIINFNQKNVEEDKKFCISSKRDAEFNLYILLYTNNGIYKMGNYHVINMLQPDKKNKY